MKFGVDVSGVRLSLNPDIDTWILHAKRNRLKNLTLNMSNNISHILPSYIFNCLTLTILELFNCVLHPPNSILCFENLINLYLKRIKFKPTIKSWIINAPILEIWH